MCPSIECPSCGKQSFHRGTCESCDYDPTQGRWLRKPIPYDELRTWDDGGFTFSMSDKPFPRIRIESLYQFDLMTFLDSIGYKGPIYERSDMFGTRYGTDIVKDEAKKSMPQFRAQV